MCSPLSVPPFLPDEVIPHHIRKLNRFPVAKGTPAQFVGEVGNAVAPAIFLRQQVNYLLHGHAGVDDDTFDFIFHIEMSNLSFPSRNSGV